MHFPTHPRHRPIQCLQLHLLTLVSPTSAPVMRQVLGCYKNLQLPYRRKDWTRNAARSSRALLITVPAARPCKLRTSLRLKRKQELEQRSITACFGAQHADSHSTALCRRPHQRTHGLRVMMGLPGSLTHRALSSDAVVLPQARSAFGHLQCRVFQHTLQFSPPVHPTPLCRQLARSRMCAHRKGQPFSSAGKHKPDAVPHKACYDLNSPLVIPAREPQANLEQHTNADMNAQQLSVLFRLLYCFLLQRRPAKYRWLVGIHQNESYFLCQLSVGPHFAFAHARRTCQAQASMAGRE